ncbi:hypothetical protein [Bacteroides pyogenes]|uniref:hypothetical protein n=1 Tax=Bacteroides pyogenes TaxID=310300 RepID=UPI001BA54CB2|nr:hypothetical protein [Bacteroides pyogenes]MBR8706442.1 hypothetical protein [Bacteroides pyogenes]
MKIKILQIAYVLWVLVTATSCKKALEEAFSKEIAINGKSVVFDVEAASRSAEAVATRGLEIEETLYDGILKINIARELEKQGLSFENLKSFLITQGTLEEEIPSGYDLQGFVGAKLYFENKSKLVAKAEKLEGLKARFTIVNGELLDQLKDDQLHIILTGVRPIKKLRMKLTMDYKARVSLIK